MKSNQYTLLFDPECSLCARFKVSLEHLDTRKQISFRSIFEENLSVEFPFLQEESFQKDVHLIRSDGEVFVGGEVIAELLKTFPLVSKFAWLIDSESSKKALGFFYKSLSRMRGSLVDCPKCQKNKL